MVGISIEIEQLEKGLTVKFVDALKDAIDRAEKEIALIMGGNHSEWELDHLRNVVIPELSELAEHAQKGEVYFKYGLHACLLYSSYLMTDSLRQAELHQMALMICTVLGMPAIEAVAISKSDTLFTAPSTSAARDTSFPLNVVSSTSHPIIDAPIF